jgi:glyoxylase-like metal-dependent hydrolase (beta-lactamase superfamily II)
MPEPVTGQVTDRGAGPVPVPGELVELLPGVARLTAPNPSMMTGPGTNTYLVGEAALVVLDPGPELPGHRAALVEAIAGRPVLAVAVTHTHPDHAPGAAALARVLDAPTAGFADAGGFVASRRLSDGEVLGEGQHALEVVHTPGHASDHCCYVLASRALCFTGDHVMGGSTVVIRPPDGSMASYLASLERLRDRVPPLEVLAPGHGRLLAGAPAAIDDVIEHRLAREAVVARLLGSRPDCSATELVEDAYPGIEERRRDVAIATLLAHLEHLVEVGQARRLTDEAPGDVEARFASTEL